MPWPTPVTREPIGARRPSLGGSRQIAEDLLAARESGDAPVGRGSASARACEAPMWTDGWSCSAR